MAAAVEIDRATQEHVYRAFLSYSHSDSRWAAWLSRSLEGYRVPRDVVVKTEGGAGPHRLGPIFRDRDELEASARLGKRIREVLQKSQSMIVICSPAAAASAWVNREIEYFRSLGREDQIFCLIVDGEPFADATGLPPDLECFPPALSQVVEHPVAADVRPGRDGRRLALLKLVAGLLGVGLDQLVHRDARRRHRQMTVAVAVSVAVAVAMGATAGLAIVSRNDARRQRAEAEGLIEFMLNDVRKTLEPAGKLDTLTAIGQHALAYYGAEPTSHLDVASLGRRARVLHLLGEVSDQRGDIGTALKFFREAAKSTEALLRRRPNDPELMFDHAQSVYWVGYMAWRKGQTAEAERRFEDYRDLAERLTTIDPKSDKYLQELAYAYSDLGTLQFENGRPDEAIKAFARRVAVQRRLLSHAPHDHDRLSDLGQSYAWLADANLMGLHLGPAMDDRIAERRIYLGILAGTPSEPEAEQALIVNREGVANILLEQGRFDDAIRELGLASKEADVLLKADPGSARRREFTAPIYVTLGDAQLFKHDYPDAQRSAATALALTEALARKDPTVVDWIGRQLGAARVLDLRVRAQQAQGADELRRALAPAEAESRRLLPFSDSKPRDLRLARATAEALLMAGDLAALSGDPAGAGTRWREGAAILLRTGAFAPGRAHNRIRPLYERLISRQTSHSLTFARIQDARAYVW
jgi:tetratricopeptide (TPR) repeat protein